MITNTLTTTVIIAIVMTMIIVMAMIMTTTTTSKCAPLQQHHHNHNRHNHQYHHRHQCEHHHHLQVQLGLVGIGRKRDIITNIIITNIYDILTITTTTVINKLSIIITSKWSWAPLELEESATTSPLAGFLIVTQRTIFEPDL